MKQNLTIQLDSETIHKARILAARHATSISRLVADELDHLVNADENYQVAQQDALMHLERGFHMGGGPLPAREELHER